MSSLMEILSKSPQDRKSLYEAKGINSITIDNEVYENYGTFSFVWEKSYIKSPIRSADGSIGNINDYATFITPHLQIHFDLMSIDDYRRLMKQDYSKNEFIVTCYDIIYNKEVTNKMYFPPEELPKLYTLAHCLQGSRYTELLGVQDFTVEMIGTNNKVE